MASLLLLATLGTACVGSPEKAGQPDPAVVIAAPVDARKVWTVGTFVRIPDDLDLPLRASQSLAGAPTTVATPAGAEAPPPPAAHVSAAADVSAPLPAAGAPNSRPSGGSDAGVAVPVAAPAPDPLPEVFTAAQMVEVFEAAGWPASEHARLLTLTHCESSWRPRAYNAGGPFYSFFQVLESNYIHFGIPPSLWFDPVTNATVARWLWETGGYSHWPNC